MTFNDYKKKYYPNTTLHQMSMEIWGTDDKICYLSKVKHGRVSIVNHSNVLVELVDFAKRMHGVDLEIPTTTGTSLVDKPSIEESLKQRCTSLEDKVVELSAVIDEKDIEIAKLKAKLNRIMSLCSKEDNH